MTPTRRNMRVLALVTVLAAGGIAPSALTAVHASERGHRTNVVLTSTFLLPHFLEGRGRTTKVGNTFDTTVFATYSAGLLGGTASTATVDVYVFDQATGGVLRSSTGDPVCDPCTSSLSASKRKAAFSLDASIVAAGGFAKKLYRGFAYVRVTGDGAGVGLEAQIANAGSSPKTRGVYGEALQPVGTGAYTGVTLVPDLREKEGRVTDTQHTFDTSLYLTYVGGLLGFPGASASVDLYLYDELGNPMRSATDAIVCDPCSYALDAASPRRLNISVDALITDAGGFTSKTMVGFASIVVAGPDPDNVNVQGFVVNAKTSAFDVSVFGFDPQPSGP